MADYRSLPEGEAFSFHFNRMAYQLRVAMPGIVRSFDPATQIATVQPALLTKVNLGGGEVRHMEPPTILSVPVVLPFSQGAGLLMTLPIRPGDECLLIFADRALDFFIQGGGLQPIERKAGSDTTNPRQHHLTDAICIPGIISNPQAVPHYNLDNIEIRDRARQNYISLGPEGITMTDGKAKWVMHDGKVTLNAPTGIEEKSRGPISRRTRDKHIITGNDVYLDCEGGMTNDKAGSFRDPDSPDNEGWGEEEGSLCFVIQSPEGEPLDEVEYVISDGYGKEYAGVTGEDGCTKVIYGKIDTGLKLHLASQPDVDIEGYISIKELFNYGENDYELA